MKKIFFLCLTFFAITLAKANETGHFFVDLSSQSISISSISNNFSNYVDVANGSTFTLFRDTTDELGIRHQSYQQNYQGTKVQSHMILVHSKNGLVRTINGAVMTNSSTPLSSTVRISRRQAAAKAPVEVADSSVSMVFYCMDGIFYRVYKVPSPKTYETLYVDVTSGEIIYRESAMRNADVIGRGYTRYSGWQNMTIYDNDGKYYLMDTGRNMVTMSAENGSPNIAYYMSESYFATLPEDVLNNFPNMSPEAQQEIVYQYIMTPMMNEYIQNTCVALYSEETDIYTPRIKSITISSAASSWWYDIWDTKPDLYCKICDPDGNVLYTTNTKEDCTLPVTFNFATGIAVTKGCIVKIYDEDATSDSYGGGVTLTSVTPGTKTWSGSNTSGSIVIEASPIEYADIHWGMQKTMDFYQNIFNRNSFDGNGHIVINLAFPPKDKLVFKTMPNNAAAQSTYEPYYMYYGWGDGSMMNPVVSLDVMAHEFTHMVTGTNGNGGLDYKLESGALNESFSDIMAMAIMQYTYGSCQWTIGADVAIPAPNFRSMSDPKNSGGANGDTTKLFSAQPDTYKGECWSYIPAVIDTNQVVVHRNSGVQNYWFYLLSEGGSGTNDYSQSYNVTGIGISKATHIAFRNLIYYLVPCATFEDARNGSIQAVIDLYGKGSQEHQSVVNAWYAVGVGNAYEAEPITIKAKMPSNWGTTISAWVWADGSEGNWVTLAKEGEWYSYTTTESPLNIIFVNGTIWNGDNNQSVDISITESTCVQIGTNTGKRTYTIVDCPTDEFQLTPGKYVIVANRAKETDDNWYYMTSDLGTASTKRFQAVSTGVSMISDVIFSDLEDKYIWDLEADGNNWKLKNGTQYISWSSGNSAKLDATGKSLTFEIAENQVQAHFNDGTNERYLSLNATTGNNYFAFYSGTNQISYLYFLPYQEDTPEPPQPETNNYVVLAQRSASSDWFYMTSDLGTASNKRYQAVDAGTNVLANVNTSNLDSKYYWQLEENKLHTAAGYSTWVSGNTANFDETGKDLTITKQSDGTYTFSFADGTNTRYLSLNKTDGNNYFAYYSGTGQIYKLTLVKEGESGTTTGIEEMHLAEPQNATKIIRNGQILIIRGDKIYTVQGQEVK